MLRFEVAPVCMQEVLPDSMLPNLGHLASGIGACWARFPGASRGYDQPMETVHQRNTAVL